MPAFSFDRLVRATGNGVDRLVKSYGVEPDPDMRAYNALKPEDFDVLAGEFGMDETAQYIEDMERRRMKRG